MTRRERPEESDPSSSLRYPLTSLPANAGLHSVTAETRLIDDRSALCVQLTDTAAAGTAGIDHTDQATFVLIPTEFVTGTLSVDVRSRLASSAPPDARGFAGLAYRIAPDLSTFEAVYLRPLNGSRLDPPAPRHLRAVQYFAYPDWPFSRLRENYPEQVYEAPADVDLDTWIKLRLHITDTSVQVEVDERTVLTVTAPKASPAVGGVGLFVDIGTEALFSNLRINPSPPVANGLSSLSEDRR